jgi:hypothetical protein
MDANTRHVGCAAGQQGDYTAQVLEMAATWKDSTKRITVYPASGQKGVPASFNRCQEHPTPFGGVCATASPTQLVGYVVTLQADGYYAMKVQGIAFSKGSARTPVEIHRAVRYRTTKSTVSASASTPSSTAPGSGTGTSTARRPCTRSE